MAAGSRLGQGIPARSEAAPSFGVESVESEGCSTSLMMVLGVLAVELAEGEPTLGDPVASDS